MNDALDQLAIPASFARYDDEGIAAGAEDLQAWKRRSVAILSNLKQSPHATTEQTAKMVARLAPFDVENSWTSPDAQFAAEGLLASLPGPTLELVLAVLTIHVKLVFSTAPHPSVNPTTGRTLSRPAGGPTASQDMYDDQPWKAYPSIGYLILWCVKNTNSQDFEHLWHLLIPPLMTLLDDYETKHKIIGMKIARNIVSRAPSTLLVRTGIGGLLEKSFTASLLHLHNPKTPALLHITIPAFVELIDRITAADSADRINRLSKFLGDGIIGGVWIYASRDLETIEASVIGLPQVLDALGVFSIRFLRALVPQLLHPLIPVPHTQLPNSLRLASIAGLRSAIRHGRPRMHRWKGTIFDATCRCWVVIGDETSGDALTIKSALRRLMVDLIEACPSIRETEIPQVVTKHKTALHGLFPES